MASKSPYLVCIWRHMCMCMSFNNHLSGLVFLFSSPKKCFNEPFEFLLCETHSSIFPYVGTVIDVTKYVTACKDGTTVTPLDFVLCRTIFVLYSLRHYTKITCKNFVCSYNCTSKKEFISDWTTKCTGDLIMKL